MNGCFGELNSELLQLQLPCPHIQSSSIGEDVPFIIHIAPCVPALQGKLWKEAIVLYIQLTDKQHSGTRNTQSKKLLAEHIVER